MVSAAEHRGFTRDWSGCCSKDAITVFVVDVEIASMQQGMQQGYRKREGWIPLTGLSQRA